jgi:hypothetical protein
VFVSSFFCRRCELGDVDFRPTAKTRLREIIIAIPDSRSLPDDDILFIQSHRIKKRRRRRLRKKKRERERERDEVGARTTCACAACVAELSDTAAATTAETAFPAMVTIGFAAGVLSQSSSSVVGVLWEARIIVVDGDGRRAGRRDPATTRAAARPPVKLVMRVVVDDDDTAMMICVFFFFFFSKGKCHKQYTRVRVNK